MCSPFLQLAHNDTINIRMCITSSVGSFQSSFFHWAKFTFLQEKQQCTWIKYLESVVMNILIIVRDKISYKNYFILLDNRLHTGVPVEATKSGKYCITIQKKKIGNTRNILFVKSTLIVKSHH
jgi:hypothetical protein